MPEAPAAAPVVLEDAPPPAADVLVLVAHPQLDQSRANRRLLKVARSLAAADPGMPRPRVAVRELYSLYPDYLIDVPAEQAALGAARLVVWQHPIHWYSMPPLMKLWVDDVLAFNWAYGPEGHALRGKDLWLVASTGGPEDSYRPDRYNRYFFDAFLPAYEQTAALCGMRFLPPLLLHGAHKVSDEQLRAHADVYAERLASYPAWPEIEELPECAQCEVPLTARPLENYAETT
jgi:glutathione-regulated potassium-efflux system ancillary protein KefF